ncbi:MAG: hypothetical protein AAF561_08065, partial [Planctomycetota bacterium]
MERLQGELDRLEREVAHLKHLATLGTLVAQIAHESNNLLTPLVTHANATDDPEAALARCREAAAAVSRLNENVLGFSRRDADDGSVEIASCLKRVQGESADHCDVDISVPTATFVPMTDDRLAMVFRNLFANASQAQATRVDVSGQVNSTEVTLFIQ